MWCLKAAPICGLAVGAGDESLYGFVGEKLLRAAVYDELEIPHKSKSKHSSERFERSASVTFHFGAFKLNATRNQPNVKRLWF